MTEKRKPGRPPKAKTVEKRIEQALLGRPIEQEKRGRGRPRLNYDERPEHIRFIIDCSAMGYSPGRIVALLQEKYGETDDRVIGVRTIDSYRKKYFNEVQQREKELAAELPILAPSMRVRYLQQVVDEASAGVPIVNKQGQVVVADGKVVTRKDFTAIIAAVKEINAMQRDLDEQRQSTAKEMSASREIAEQKRVIEEHIAEEVERTGQTAIEILKGMSDSLIKEYPEAIELLASEYKM